MKKTGLLNRVKRLAHFYLFHYFRFYSRRFRPQDDIKGEEIEKGLQAVVKDGLASQAMSTLTGGAFLVDFALLLGASNFFIGVLAAIPALTQLIQIPATFLVEKTRRRKLIVAGGAFASRIFLLLFALIPFLFSPPRRITALSLTILFHSACNSLVSCSWSSWMRDFIPENILGSFFSRRMALSYSLGATLGLVGAFYLDFWKRSFFDPLTGYSLLFLGGVVAGFFSFYYLTLPPEPRLVGEEKAIGFAQLFLSPFKDFNFRNLLFFSGSWHFAYNLATPFFTVYLLRRLEYSMITVIILSTISQVVSILFFRWWGSIADRFSNKSVLLVSSPIFLASIFLWTFTTLPEKHAFTFLLLAIIYILLGVSTAGILLATGNIGMKLAPRGQATPYLATYNLVNSLSLGIAPLLGGKLADFFAQRELSLSLRWISPAGERYFETLSFEHWDFLFFFAFLIGLYALHRLTLVKEEGEKKIAVGELVTEMGRAVHNISSAGGIFLIETFRFPLRKKEKKRKLYLY